MACSGRWMSALFGATILFSQVGAAVVPAWADSQFNKPRQVTSNPGEDFAPTVSANGDTLVYVSDRSGNLDLWLKHLGPGVQDPDQRLTWHSGEENSPAISPDGKMLAFVSNRTDPKGDIYLLSLEGLKPDPEEDDPDKKPEEKEKLITDAAHPEADPAWSADQKQLFFTSQDPETRRPYIYSMDIGGKNRQRVSKIEGVSPALSGDGLFMVLVARGKESGLWAQNLKTGKLAQLTSGEFMDVSPRVSPDGKRVYFSRYQDDTNGDNRITIDDQPNLWSVEFLNGQPGKLRQLTDSTTYDLQPVAVGTQVYFTSTNEKGTDIWGLAPDGLLPKSEKYGNELQTVEDLCEDYGDNVYKCLLADNALINDFAGDQSLARILYRQAKGYQTLGQLDHSADIFRQIITDYAENPRYRNLAEIELLLVDVKKSREGGQASFRNRLRKGLEELKAIIQNNEALPAVAARAWVEKGHLHYELEEFSEALNHYQHVIKTYPPYRHLSAEAAFSQSKVYKTVGDQKNLVLTFVNVVRDYYDVESWTGKAIAEILEIHEQHPTLSKKIASLTALIEKYEDLPRLAGAVQNRVGELYYEAGENMLAKESYKRTIEKFDKAPEARNAARFQLAGIYAEEENFEMSLVQYQAVESDPGNLDDALEKARRGFIHKSVEKGEWELRVGEMKLARKSFLKLIDFEPTTVEAHRGYVQAEASLKRIQHAIDFYNKRIAVENPAAEDQYALGLAHTYLSPPDLDTAEQWIRKAMRLNSNNVYYHQTLGWVFEQKERAKPDSGYLERTVQEYQDALVLNDPISQPRNEANLLLNLGHGNYLLSNYFSAYLVYDQRLNSGHDFLNAEREAIYYQRFAESAFKSEHTEHSVKLYKKALELVTKLDKPKRMAELNDRIALAYQVLGSHAEAVEHFSRALALNQKTGNTVSMSRTLRNIANNLYALNATNPGRDSNSLNKALGHYFKAIDQLEENGVVQRGKVKKSSGGGLVDVSFEAGIDESASQAALGFDKKGEQKLIFHYVGKIFGDFGDYQKAIDYFEKKLSLIPKELDPKKHIPLLLEKALLLNQIGHYHFKAGHIEASKPFFKESFDISRLINNRQGIGVNASNLGRSLILQTRTEPFAKINNEIGEITGILESAERALDKEVESLANPEYRVYIKNDLGILYHYQAFHQSDIPAGKAKDPLQAVKASLQSLDAVASSNSKSAMYFKKAIDAAGALPDSKKSNLLAALNKNLELAQYISGKDKAEKETGTPEDSGALVFSEWQLRFMESLESSGDARFALLKEADAALSQLPFGVSRGPAHLSMIEDLYHQLAASHFDRREYNEALNASESLVQKTMQARLGELPLNFKGETRQALFEEVQGFAHDYKKLREDTNLDAEALQAETEGLLSGYIDFVEGVIAEEDPGLRALVLSEVPEVDSIQGMLRPGTVLVKYDWVGDGILLWWLDGKMVKGSKIKVDANLKSALERIGRKKEVPGKKDILLLSKVLLTPVASALKDANSLVLVAGGPLEFLPWAALPLEGEPLIQKVKLSYQTSLGQFALSETTKNLYNSRLLAVEMDGFDGIRERFVSAENLLKDDGSVEQYSKRFRHFGVVAIDSPAYLAGLDLDQSYISLTRRVRHFERLQFEQLLSQSVESNFIALNEIDFRFSPETSVSPTAPLIHSLTYAGYPGVLLHQGVVDPKRHAAFLAAFFETFRKGNPAESLRQAQLALAKSSPGSADWATYRYYGFPGMSEKEKNEFAEGRYKQNVDAGVGAFKDKNWLAAISRFEKALVLIDFLEDQSQAGQLNKLLAQAAYNLGDYKKGVHYQKQVLALAEKAEDPEQVAEAHFFLGILYSRDEDFAPSVENLTKALKFYEEYEILDKLAESYSTLGIVEENALDYDDALKAFSASIRLNEEMGEDLNRGRELRRIGRIYLLRLNNYPKAEEFFTAANTLFQELDVPEQTAESWLEMGQVAEKQSRFDDATALYVKAQTLAQEKDLPLQLSKSYLYQGNTQWFQGNYQNAFRLQKQALEVAEKINNRHQQIWVYNTLGLIYWTLNDSTRALSNLDKSREMAEDLKAYLDVASAYNNMGLVYRKDKKYEKSIELFNEALKRDEKLKSKWGQGYTHRNLGISYLRLKKLDEAEGHIQKAIALSSEIGNNTNLIKAKLELGNLARERKQCQNAIGTYKETAQLAKRYNIKEVLWRALRGQGACLKEAGKQAEAIAAYKQGVDVVDSMRASIKVEEFQNGFLTDKQDIYKELILLLLDAGQTQASFEYAERAKARSFIDLLGNQKMSLKDDVGQKMYDSLTGQKQVIRQAEEELANTEGEEEVKKAQTKLVAARTRYQDLLIEVKEKSPQISNFVTVESITLEKLTSMLAPDVSLVEYLVTERELVAWVITTKGIKVVRTPIKEIELVEAITDYRNRMQNVAPLEEQSKSLYKLVVTPVLPYLAGTRVVGIVPHSHLHYLSFSSLYDGESYLIEKHPLFFSPSASVLEYTFKRKQKHEGPIKVLAMGNPDLGTLNYDLPLAELEANAIRWDFPEVTILTREKASESWLQKNISDYQIIHIASHGEFDPVNPLFSSLKLARDDEADGNFEVNEVFSLDIKADLVTLSACQTGLGEITGGDELVGLNRAFIYAGTHAIVSSLWRVSDISTAVLIKHFYRNYIKENKGESLRKAQLQVKRLYPHPSYWAGFILTGDYR
ncbi:MAG: CHAT domain-containing protein [Candidatus Nitronauta litoralis]|uniref:CHAT domain-containing protein n=1 Tax=Candidatus Nitronauta litoralis TaxID=2705533 RepID=A0A7T0BTB5_9BACT|nr:MAG: CHAT domain-containing protein [Candidatus Nitronauta litoralis]